MGNTLELYTLVTIYRFEHVYFTNFLAPRRRLKRFTALGHSVYNVGDLTSKILSMGQI